MFAAQLSAQLVSQGHEVKMVFLVDGDAALPFTGEMTNLRRPLAKRLLDVKGWKMLAGEISAFQPDVIQANAADTLKYAVFSKLCFRWQAPVIYRNANKMSDFIDSTPKFWFNKFLLGRVAHTISVSEQCSLDLVRTFSYPKEKVDTVEIGIDLRETGNFPGDLAWIAVKGPVLLNVASMVPEKNQKGLLRIFQTLLRHVPDAQLVVIGKGRLEQELKALATSLKIDHHVHFPGARTDVLEIMRGCKAFLLPSHIEGLPGVILEAMYTNCPVVAYDVGGIGEVVRNGDTGLLISRDDEGKFAQAVLAILGDTTLSEKLAASAAAMVRSRFGNISIARRFIEVYDKVLTGKEKPSKGILPGDERADNEYG
jgi:glycosyltransferase involved in cell wall biosynthesis